MIRYFFLLFILSLISGIYRPMSDKEIKFDSDVCHYSKINEDQKIEYVKGCKKGKVCIPITNRESDYEISKCLEEKEIPLLKLGEKNCKYNIQCDSNLECIFNVCTVDVNSSNSPYYKGGYYFCPEEYVTASYYSFSQIQCQKKSEFSHTSKCYVYDSYNGSYYNYYYAPGFQEVCGKITTEYRGSDLEIKEIESNKIGSQNTGTFVKEMAACKSGYAIEYCLDGNYECSSSSIPKSLKCIDVKEINLLNDCTIKYNDGNEDMTIKLEKGLDDCLEIQVKLEMFKKYVDKMSKCDDVKPYDNEPLTCGNKDLRKYWYFYNIPKEYILYIDEDDVIDYLIQSAYSSSYYLTFAKLSILLMIFFI